jgi:hypothetical protein
MSTAQPVVPGIERTGTPEYEPETPFASDGYARIGTAVTPAPGRTFGPTPEFDTPFLSEYAGEGLSEAGSPQAEMFASLLGELYDQEFEEAVTDLVNEASALADDRLNSERADTAQERMDAESAVRQFLAPLERQCTETVDRLVQGLANTDVGTMTEDELETLMDRFSPDASELPPVLENFSAKFLKKAKGLVKLASKGRGLLAKISPIHMVLAKLKGLVKPLLDKVLRFAINKLPVSVRPMAQQLAKRLLNKAGEPEAMEDEDEDEAAAADPVAIAQELDTRLAGFMVEGESFDRYSEVQEFAQPEDEESSEAWSRLQRRRRAFAKSVVTAPPEADIGPQMEEFIPAIMAALKVGIKIIGRPRVVSTIATMVANLIKKYVGEAQAMSLSRALVDAGLQLVSLEASEGAPGLEAGEALAATVEDTVGRVVRSAPESAYESDAVLEGYVREAFGEAASAHFPDSMIRPELHEAADISGVWQLRPGRSASKHYKKYSRILEVTLTPQMAQALKSFGGAPVKDVLRDQHRLSVTTRLRVRVHLYEAIAGTTLSAIAHHERSVRGLGSSRREAWSLIHPLTPEAAGILLKEPGLGHAVDPKFLAGGTTTALGQRFYYLEVRDGAAGAVQPMGARRPGGRVSQTRVVLNFPAGHARAILYYSEAEAHALVASLGARTPIGVLINGLKAGLQTRLAAMLSGPSRALRIVHESVASEDLLPKAPSGVLRLVGRPLSKTLLQWVLETFRRELERRRDEFAAEFKRAAASDADGVTLVVTFPRPPFFEQLRGLLSGNPLAAGARLRISSLRQPFGEYTLAIRPGFARS